MSVWVRSSRSSTRIRKRRPVERANSHANTAVRRLPMCRSADGLGANRPAPDAMPSACLGLNFLLLQRDRGGVYRGRYPYAVPLHVDGQPRAITPEQIAG